MCIILTYSWLKNELYWYKGIHSVEIINNNNNNEKKKETDIENYDRIFCIIIGEL